MKIKICGMTDKENIQSLSLLKPDFMGFIFYPHSERFMAEKLFPEDLLPVDPSVSKVGVFVNPGEEEVLVNRTRYALDLIQLHGHESPAFCAGLREHGIDIIKAFRVDEFMDFRRLIHYVPYCRYFLFDSGKSKYGGSGEKFDWSLLNEYQLGLPFFLSGGISPGDEEAISSLNHPAFIGIDLNSRFEDKPGIKNYHKLQTFIDNLRKTQR